MPEKQDVTVARGHGIQTVILQRFCRQHDAGLLGHRQAERLNRHTTPGLEKFDLTAGFEARQSSTVARSTNLALAGRNSGNTTQSR